MTTEKYKIELHGGGRRHRWREVGNSLRFGRAQMQAKLLIGRARQGGVRVIDPLGYIVEAWWRRHAPGARPERIRFCIGCGCHDFDACIDPESGGSCRWLATQRRGGQCAVVGVCSACASHLPRWKRGERKVPA
jgi:hypothetical protein